MKAFKDSNESSLVVKMELNFDPKGVETVKTVTKRNRMIEMVIQHDERNKNDKTW